VLLEDDAVDFVDRAADDVENGDDLVME